MPTFVSYESSDVWSNRIMFLLFSDGTLSYVPGVPLDGFSSTGQIWNIHLYSPEYREKN